MKWSHWHFSSTAASHPPLKYGLFQDAAAPTNEEPLQAHTPWQHPIGTRYKVLTSNQNKAKWPHPEVFVIRATNVWSTPIEGERQTFHLKCRILSICSLCRAERTQPLHLKKNYGWINWYKHSDSSCELTQQTMTICGCPVSVSPTLQRPYMGLLLWNFPTNSVKPPAGRWERAREIKGEGKYKIKKVQSVFMKYWPQERKCLSHHETLAFFFQIIMIIYKEQDWFDVL